MHKQIIHQIPNSVDRNINICFNNVEFPDVTKLFIVKQLVKNGERT